MYKLNTRVRVVGDETKAMPLGLISGMGHTVDTDDGSMVPCYIVRLDVGFYNDRGGFISQVVVHPDNIREER